MEIKEVISACGHRNIQATHRTTLEITKDAHLSRKGDCIIAVSADKALADLSPKFKENLRRENAMLAIFITAGEITEVVRAAGSPKLILTHNNDLIVRKSDYICGRTLAIGADKAACDLSKELVERLKDPNQKVSATLLVKT